MGSEAIDSTDSATKRLEALWQRFDGRLRRYVVRVSRAEDAEDILHDIYTRLARQAHADPPPEFNATYVFRTADSVLRDRYRRHKSHQREHHIEVPHDLAAPSPSPFDEVRWRQNADALRKAIAGLNRQERLVLLMHRIEGHKLTEIARSQNIPLRSVQRLLAGALAKCRHKLKDSGWFEI